MYFTKNTQKYIAFSEDSLLDVLKKISANKSRLVFVVSERAKLLGSLSDGDIRRWLVESNNFDLGAPVYKIMNAQNLPEKSVKTKIETICG